MALTTNQNYLQPNGFRVIISREHYPNLEFFAQSIIHPGMNMTPAEVPFRRINASFPGDKITFPPLSITAILDEDMTTYIEMVQWMERLVETKHKPPSQQDARSEQLSQSDIRLMVLTSHNNKNKTILYKDCFPTDLSPVTFEASTGDVTYITFNVDFKYTYWEIV
jgi:hypothetical protein|tara:strand:- start:6177 stop:6674 length:498 start_codon:yes stop_codon:yes gene_type:complete